MGRLWKRTKEYFDVRLHSWCKTRTVKRVERPTVFYCPVLQKEGRCFSL